MLRNFLIVIVLTVFSQLSFAQNLPSGVAGNSLIKVDIPAQNLKTYQAAFEEYMEKNEVEKEVKNKAPEGEAEIEGYNQFKRWEWIMQSRTFPTGNLPDPAITARERSNYLKLHPYESDTRNATWSPVGTADVPSNGGGAGRINVIRFDPVNAATIYVGAAGGGIWKTTDAGSTWNPLGDQLPVTSIADIAINPSDPDILYVATGDGYGYEATWQTDMDFWGGVYAAGILKSTDGGSSWQPTGLSFEQENLEIVQRMLIHPTNPEILLAATRNGIFRTADGGINWLLVSPVHCYDMAFNTSNPDIIYAGGNQDILQSTDAGATWSILKDNLGGAGRISIETSAADPAVIYALYESNSKLYKSVNSGTTWTTVQSPSSATFYGYYDMAFTVSPADASILFAGGLLVTKSVNGGQSWQVVSAWDSYPSDDYVHADNHALSFDPSGATIYSGNDGGLFNSTNLGDKWTDLSNGLSISQIYRLSSSVTNPDIIYSGWQDNGSNRWNGTNWKQVFGADGMQPLVDYTNENIVYICYQYGALHKSTDGGENFQSVAPGSGGWVTPYAMDPVNHNILYYGANSVYKTTNGASSWTTAGSNLFSSLPCNAIAIAPSNPNYVYAASLDKMFVTSTGGNPWTNITAGLPVTTSGINYIAVDNTDPLNVWVAISGYVGGSKVFHSVNGGTSWTNMSGSLPNVPVNCIVYEPDSQDGVYIGTDIGIFYHDNTLADWVPYNAGLPNVMVHHLEINPTTGKLLAATYGRGIWESDLYYTVQFTNDIGTLSITAPSNEVCSSVVNPVIKVKNYGTNTVTSFQLVYAVDGGSNLTYDWLGSLGALESVMVDLPAITGLAAGPHTFSVSTSLPNGLTDNNTVNDPDNSSFTIVGSGLLLPYQEGFEAGIFPPSGWTLENDNLLWSETGVAGGFGNSVHSAQADFYNVFPGGMDELMTPYLDFSTAIPPVKLKFSYAYAKKNIAKTDTLKIAVSVDCGATFNNVFVKGGTDLATAPDQTGSVFIPEVSEWKDEIIDLAAFASADKVLVRFSALSDKGNNLYVDDINLYGSSTSFNNIPLNSGFNVYPNPAAGEFTVSLNDNAAADVTIEVFNMLGQQVNTSISKTSAGPLTYHLRLIGAENGWHLVKVKSSNQTFVQPLLIER